MYDQDYSWLFSFGTGVSLLAMTLSRYLHEWANFYVVRTNIPRKRMWLVPLAMAILILCLPLFTVETDCAGGECKRTGLSATAYLLCISACLFVATVCDVVSHITPNEVKELLEEFRGMTTDLRAGVIPDDIDDSLIDVDKLTVIGTTLVGVTKFRKPGSRAVRFSDRFMADVARERMGAKKQRVLKKAHVVASFASMFTQYQGAVDENEPAHPLGTTNLAKDRWKSSTVRTRTRAPFEYPARVCPAGQLCVCGRGGTCVRQRVWPMAPPQRAVPCPCVPLAIVRDR